VYGPRDIGTAVWSGSFVTAGMLVTPCSVKTLSGMAHSYNENLVVRAVHVRLKERRRVVLVLRETPLHAARIELTAQATRNGAIIKRWDGIGANPPPSPDELEREYHT
jgi:flavin prenyltransferase